MPGGAWDTLATTDQTLPDWGRRLRSGTTGNDSFYLSFERSLGQEDAYPNSTLGRYFNGGRWGWIAVGIPTPVASLPTSGSASYSGIVRGAADVMVDDGWGGLEPTDVTGSVTLTFDFGHSSLAGSMSASLANFGTVGVLGSLGTVNFANTVYSAGHYSGTFATSVAGVNSFSGTLTGPGAQELIGAWAMPFHYSVDGQDHQAAGAWVAKKP